MPGPRMNIVGDLREPRVRRVALRDTDVVVHAAALHALVPARQAVWVDESLRPLPRDIYDETKLAAERLVTASPTPSVVLRIARCFPEPLPVLATHLLHRAVGLADVASATVRAATHDTATGTYNIAVPYAFTRADCPALHRDAPAVIAERLPEVTAAFRAYGWTLPPAIDRVYDSTAAVAGLRLPPDLRHPSAAAVPLRGLRSSAFRW